MEMLRVLIVEPHPGQMKTVTDQIRNADEAQVIGLARDGLEAAQKAVIDMPDVVILPADIPGMDPLRACALVTAAAPGVSVVLLASNPTSELVRRAMLHGVRAVVDPSSPAMLSEVMASLREVQGIVNSEEYQLATDLEKMPMVITVTSAKGGVGKTTIAVNLAVSLARRTKQPVVLIDSFAQFGDAAVALNISPPGNLNDVLERIDQLDLQLLLSYLADHPSGLKLLAGPTEPVRRAPTEADWAQLISLLRRRFRYIVLDCPPIPWSGIDYVLSRSDLILLVTTAVDVINVRNTAMLYQYMVHQLEFGNRTRLVVSQVSRSDPLTVADVEGACGTKAYATVPYDPEAVREAANRGEALVDMAPSSEVAKSIQNLCRRILDERDKQIRKALEEAEARGMAATPA